MSLQLDKQFSGVDGATFTADADYATVSGTPTFVACSYGQGLRFSSGASGYVQHLFTGGATTGPRYFSRIYKLSAYATNDTEVWQVRSSSGRGCGAQILGNDGRLRIINAAGGILATSTAGVPVGTEFRVVFYVNGTTFTATIYPNITSRTPTQVLSGSITSQSIDRTRDGRFTAASGGTLDFIWPQDDNASDPGPRVNVSVSLDISTGIVPKLVTATASVVNSPAGTKAWTFDWGDGTTTGPQASATATHTYTVAGTYNVVATLDVT